MKKMKCFGSVFPSVLLYEYLFVSQFKRKSVTTVILGKKQRYLKWNLKAEEKPHARFTSLSSSNTANCNSSRAYLINDYVPRLCCRRYLLKGSLIKINYCLISIFNWAMNENLCKWKRKLYVTRCCCDNILTLKVSPLYRMQAAVER